MKCELWIDDIPFSFELDGQFSAGKDEVLFNKQSNVLSNCDWIDEGYKTIKLFSEEEFQQLKESTKQVILKLFEENDIFPGMDFQLEDYHRYVINQELHKKIINKTRFLTHVDFQINFGKINKIISEALHCRVGTFNPHLKKEVLILRISRPNTMDINPLHRDGYLEVWKDVLNVWIPIAGCNKQSSLPLIPGSHYWNEKDLTRTQNQGASINGITYQVPGIIDASEELRLIRPNPLPCEGIIFTPFLIHGSAVNLTSNATRFSLELRLYNQDIL